MSTSIKRIALVAVAALGLGVVSVAPSSAMTFSDSLALSAATSTQLTSETATASSAVATLTFLSSHADDSMSVVATLVSGPAGNTALPYLLLSETTSAEAKVGTDVLTSTDTTGVAAGTVVKVAPKATTFPVNATAKFKVFMNAPTKVGTYVVKITPAVLTGGGTLAGAAQTLTITVTQNAATDTVAASATSFLNAGETNSATADVTVTGSKTASTSAAAGVIKVSLKNANGNAVTAESFTATISGPGLLGSGPFGAGTTLDDAVVAKGRALTVKNGDVVAVFPDGTSGVATVTIGSAAGVILATETLTFFGDAAKIVTTVKKAVIGGTTEVAGVLSIVVTDAAGVSVSNLTSVNVVSSDATKIAGAYTAATLGAYSTTTGAYLVPLTPVAAGSANITVTTKASATATTGVSADAVSVRVGSSTPASVSVTTDKSSYAPGEKATISVILKDAAGLVLADGDYTSIFATGGIVGSYTINGDTTTATSVLGFASGTKDYTVYLPVTEGDVKFSWTTGTGLATANQAVAGSVTVSVSSAGTSAAIDAANEASQAASDATDAALAAADAADAATTKAQEAVDAVATLSAQVSKLITALKAQITTLTNLVIKIQKKVKA